jgi:hypothetical protein
MSDGINTAFPPDRQAQLLSSEHLRNCVWFCIALYPVGAQFSCASLAQYGIAAAAAVAVSS